MSVTHSAAGLGGLAESEATTRDREQHEARAKYEAAESAFWDAIRRGRPAKIVMLEHLRGLEFSWGDLLIAASDAAAAMGQLATPAFGVPTHITRAAQELALGDEPAQILTEGHPFADHNWRTTLAVAPRKRTN